MNFLHCCRKQFENISSEWSFCAGAAAGVLFAPAALVLCLFLPRSRMTALAAGTLLVLLVQLGGALQGPVSFEKLLEDRGAQIEYEVRLDDLRLTRVPGLEQPRGVAAELKRFRFAGGEEWHSCRGRITFFSNLPVPPEYGMCLSGTGTLIKSSLPWDRDPWRIFTDTYQIRGCEKTWRTWVLKLRDSLLERLCSNIRDDTDRNLAAAFFLGTTGGMTQERRRDFAAAGTVHLFAVSGLHVGMAAMLILLLLRFTPFVFRCFAAALLVWCYVLLTGAAVPALRAGFMIGLFLCFRGLLLSVSPLRIMGIAAAVIIIADPDALYSIGFHYSFLITAVLLLLAEKLNDLRLLQSRHLEIMPFNAFTLRERRKFYFGFSLQALLVSGFAAALAGSVVSLYHTMALTPGAVIANWFTMPVLGLLFAMFPVKLLASCCGSAADRIAGSIIEMFFGYLRTVAGIMSDWAAPFHAVPPGIFMAAVLTCLLLGALSFRRRLYAVLAGGAFLLTFLIFPLTSFWSKPRITVISSDSGTPASVVVADTGLRELTLVNPVRNHIPETEQALKRSGISRIAEVLFSRSLVRNVTGLDYLCGRFKVEKVVMPPGARRNGYFTDRITERGGDFYYVHEGKGGEKVKIFREKSKFAIEYPDSGVMLGWRLEITDRDKGRVLDLYRNNKKVTALLPWSCKNGVWHYEL